jgi:hypothetical protein
MIDIFMVIALWCGMPINSTKGAMGIKTGSEISISNVNGCRARLIECVEKYLDDGRRRSCFKNEVLK